MSNELHKVKVNFTEIDLNKLQSYELFGLYLNGEITGNLLTELLNLDIQTINQLIKRVCTDIDNTSKKDESQVEMDF